MVTSVLAGIIERGGGIRVIVTARENVQCHVGDGEKAYIVPDFFIDGPVPMQRYPALVQRAIKYVKGRTG